jgi:hypothetical protein
VDSVVGRKQEKGEQYPVVLFSRFRFKMAGSANPAELVCHFLQYPPTQSAKQQDRQLTID